MAYRVLKARFERTGETEQSSDGRTIHIQRVAEWIEIGRVQTPAEGFDRYGHAAVLERVGGHGGA